MKPKRFDLICVVSPVMSGMMRCSKDLGYVWRALYLLLENADMFSAL